MAKSKQKAKAKRNNYSADEYLQLIGRCVKDWDKHRREYKKEFNERTKPVWVLA
jgi:hypothetical protein